MDDIIRVSMFPTRCTLGTVVWSFTIDVVWLQSEQARKGWGKGRRGERKGKGI